MMEALHHEELAVHGVMGLIQPGARHRHLGVFKDCIPASFLVLKPAPHTGAIGCPSRSGNMISKVA
jgi:hypothetical protein